MRSMENAMWIMAFATELQISRASTTTGQDGQIGILLGPIPLAQSSSTASMMVQKELGQMVKNAGMTAKSIQQKES